MQGSQTEKRNSIRRTGNPTAVEVMDQGRVMRLTQGWVTDRSSGGLSLLLDDGVPVGTIVSVRPQRVSEMTPWVEVEVRSCRTGNGGWVTGTQFLRTPPWSVLLLFG
jgi:hypothetical protein